MAFGFGFNKQKALSTAEKFVQQGKLQNAINEYEKVLKADAKDLTVMNTVGDLYARLGQNEKAVQCFKSVGDAYASQGFTVKAIAMYKKLTKIKSSLESVLRLAELYTQQGLFNDARAQYLQVAEEFLRAGELEQAVRIFQKTLEMDPENVAMRTRLAEVYVRLGKKSEARAIFLAAAESLRARGALGAAEEIAQRMLTLDPSGSDGLLLRARLAFDSGDVALATQHLEKVADLDNHPEGLQVLTQCYVKTGRLLEAGTLAAKLCTVHNDTGTVRNYADALIQAGRYEDALKVFEQYSEKLLANEPAKILETLHTMIGHVRDNTAALEILVHLLQKAGENTHLTEIYELLAHGYVQSEHLEKARDYYLKLTQLEPQNQLHARNYQQVLARLGSAPSGADLITAEEGAVLVDELEATAPFIDQRYADDVALAVRSALTDAELFLSYNMPAKALGPLLLALPKAPTDLRLNQRLAALHTRAERFAEAAVCCRTLESIYHDAGHPDEATRYGELAGKYEQRATAQEPKAVESFEVQAPQPEGEAPHSAPAPVATTAAAPSRISRLFWHAPVAAAPAPPAPAAAAPELQKEPVQEEAEAEIDLSEEWEGEISEPAVEAAPAAVAPEARPADKTADLIRETIDEVRFYLKHGLAEQARAPFAKLEFLHVDPSTLAAIRAEIDAVAAAAAPSEAADEVSVEEVSAGPPAEAEEFEPVVAPPVPAPAQDYVAGVQASAGEMPAVLPHSHVPEPPPQAVMHHAGAAQEQEPSSLGEFVADLESSLGDSFLAEKEVPQRQHGLPAAMHVPAAQVPLGPTVTSPSFPGSHASAAAAAPAPVAHHAPLVPPSAPAGSVEAAAGFDLADMFTDLKHELEEETTVSGEDPETHYSLGVAFREMGLLDEAISELQKVCQSVERGHSFAHTMEAYTWLAQCFLDKGVPEAAIKWYERALKLPNLDGDTCMALHYELGSSYQAAQNKTAALNHFMEVYGSNIDYRDVAERIKALRS